MIKDDILKVRMSKQEKEEIRYFARRKGFNMSEYIKYCIMKAESQEGDKSINREIEQGIKF